MEKVNARKLINEIHLRPAIWDMRSGDYLNKLKKKRSWEEVTHAFVDEDTAPEKKRQIGGILQKKWKNIRDRYARDQKENKGKSGQERKGKYPYMYSNQLAFLTDVILGRPAGTSMDGTDPLSPIETSGIQHVTNKKRIVLKRKVKRAHENNNIRQKQKDVEDDDKLFLLSLSPFLKSIPSHLKLAARMDIMKSINKYIQPEPYSTNSVSFVEAHDQQWQYSNSQPGHSDVQYHSNPSPVFLQQELQSEHSGIDENILETLIKMSPKSTASVNSEDDTD